MGEAGTLRRPPGLGPMAEQDQALEPGWLLSSAGRPYLDSILHKNQRRVFGGCPSPRAPQVGFSAPRITLSPLPRSAGAPGAAACPDCPHCHLQTLPGGEKRRREDSAGGLAGGDPRAPRPPRDPGYGLGVPGVTVLHVPAGIEATTATTTPWIRPGGSRG